MQLQSFKKPIALLLLTAVTTIGFAPSASARCVYPDDLDSRGRRCGGRASSVRPGGYEPPPRYDYSTPSYGGASRSNTGSIPGWVYLTASDASSRINVRSQPSVYADTPHYGLVGDRVWATDVVYSDGYYWYFVGFPESQATGWVRGDLIAR